VTGILLLLVEILLIPGFGVIGFAGIMCMLAGLFGMLIKNPPGRLPWPESEFDWKLFINEVWAIGLGFIGFVVLAALLRKYLPRTTFFSRLMLAPATAKRGSEMEISMTAPAESAEVTVRVGNAGEALSRLRPAGKARFGEAVVDVVAEGSFVDKGAKVTIIEVRGNRVVVRQREGE
jgi:membrane-bound serine protease (ClpP class)